MGLFTGLDLESASENPFEIPTDTYDIVSSEVEVKNGKKNPDEQYLVVTWTILSGDFADQEMQTWKRIPGASEPEGKKKTQAKGFLKQMLLAMGIPESRMDDVTPDDLTNIRARAYCELNNGFTNPSFQEGHFFLEDVPPAWDAPQSDSDDGMGVFAGQ